MSIQFCAKIDDPETERLLLFLEEHYGSNYVHKVEMLKQEFPF
jgi:hypothetical protein